MKKIKESHFMCHVSPGVMCHVSRDQKSRMSFFDAKLYCFTKIGSIFDSFILVFHYGKQNNNKNIKR